jgi:hypothetical protein
VWFVIKHHARTSTPKRFSSGHEIEVRLSIAVSLEDGNGSYAALSDVMWIPRRYDEPHTFSQEKLVLCPWIRPPRFNDCRTAGSNYFHRNASRVKCNRAKSAISSRGT